MGTSSGVYELNHECASTFVPLRCDSLVFLWSICWQDVVWLTFPWDPH